jgi:hypothetical protein
MTRQFRFAPHGTQLVLDVSAAEIGFAPTAIWNPSPSVSHRLEAYPLPQTLTIGIKQNELTAAKFSPPPFAVLLHGEGRKCYIGVAAEAGWHRWNDATFEATPDGIRIIVELEGRTDPAAAAEHVSALAAEFEGDFSDHEILRRGLVLQYLESQRELPASPEWWLKPIYCGWGDQVAFAMHEEGVGPERRALAYCIQGLYERWIAKIEAAEVPVGTVIIDAGWSLTGVWEPDPIRWPDLRGFIRRQHEAGRRVLLWIGTWLWDGLPPELCITGDGRQWEADPTNPRYLEKLRGWVHELLSPDGLDADGFKIDQLGFCPNAKNSLWGPRFGFTAEGGPVQTVQMHDDVWGVELLYQYQRAIYRAAKAAKPDCLVTSSTVHPYFEDTYDMTRLHDMGHVTPHLMESMKARADLSRAVFPAMPIDADDWVHIDYDLWLDYTCRSHQLGVPCLFYTEQFIVNWQEEPATMPITDLKTIARAWKEAGY